MIRVGTAGWSIPKGTPRELSGSGSHLQRYAQVFVGVEVNSTFYSLPRRSTFERWRDCTPPDFRFALKMPGAITHESCLRGVRAELTEFIELARALGQKLGPILVQLAPSHELDRRVTRAFLRGLRALHDGAIAWEPRHSSWASAAAVELLTEFGVSRVAADPAPFDGAGAPAGARSLTYYRLHGSPHMYYSEYSPEHLGELARTLRSIQGKALEPQDIWCVFDNTARGAAMPNALELLARLRDVQASAECASELASVSRGPSVPNLRFGTLPNGGSS